MKGFINLFLLLFLISGISAKAGLKPDKIQVVSISTPTDYIEQAFDVIKYDAFLDLTKAPSPEMSGECTIKLFWKDNPNNNKFYFHLRSLNIDSILYNKIPVVAKSVGDTTSATYHWEIDPPQNSEQDTAYISIWYHGTMTNALDYNSSGDSFGGVFSSDSLLYSIGVGFSNNYVSSTQHWLPCYDHPSDKAIINFAFKVKNGFQVASNGKLVNITDNGDQTKTFLWKSDFQTATNLMTFTVGKIVPVNINGFYWPIVIYCKPSDTLAVKNVFRLVPRMVTTFQNKFLHPYPFEKIGYVLTSIPSGMEHQTMVTMQRDEVLKMFATSDSMNSTAAHELSHQWFGDMVTPFDYRDAWLNEGFANFCQNIWYEDIQGYDTYLKKIYSQNSLYLNSVISMEGILPLYDFPRKPPSSNYPYTIYYKGCAVVALLRYHLGDSIFYDVIGKFLSANEYKNTATTFLKTFLNENSGENLDWFFNQWVYKPGYPNLNILVHKKKFQDNFFSVNINIMQVQPDSFGIYTHLPIELGFQKPDGKYIYKIVELNQNEENFTIDSLPDFIYVNANQGPTVRPLMKISSLTTTSVRENLVNNPELTILPNPANSFIEFKYGFFTGDADLKIFDIDGNEIIKDKIRASVENKYKFNCSHVPSGNYFIYIGNSDFTKTINFSVVH